ncbi:ABC-three component system protein [Candidatus Viridilinea mediisalina]|nr:ABC-three component system protein [Candidatus Viridilinea mediisalina]
MPTFKSLSFKPGLNILLAEKSPGASERQTRNGAGKTSLIEIIHFLMGADRHALFKSDLFKEYYFGMDIDIRGNKLSVERSAQKSSDVRVRGDLSSSGLDVNDQKSFGESSLGIVISNNYWKDFLGQAFFNLDPMVDEQKFGPNFRMLFAYFVRRQMSNAFISPYKQSDMQQIWDQQVAISYLLGLDWTIPRDWQLVREQEKGLKELRKAADGGTLSEVIGTTAELRTQMVIAEDKARRLREQLNSFQVLPQYREIEIEASRIGRQIGSLSDDNAIDNALIEELELSLRNELDPSYEDLAQLYEEIGVVLPEIVSRRFDEVRIFHDSIVRNRRTYLEGEIAASRQRIEDRRRTQETLSVRQMELMSLLRSYGALEQFAQLQTEYARTESEAEGIRKRYAAAEQLEGKKTQLGIERTQLLRRLQQDYSEQREALQRAILAFEQISNALYEQAGSLTIVKSINGPLFDIIMPASKSKGISNMQIFCFDMMLMRLCSERGIGLGFLVHDSHLFDGVDERQIAKALEVGNAITQEIGIQYIVTMNSDTLPRTLVREFDLDKYILPTMLTDATTTGGLFGIRFD